ncbi:alcohol dehydrogenase 1-like [Dromiciops gliroides]|uniref:alcohol dehydrogenase 1-like n=1 Tax=Dromiciops gliroides TaxID=33562 RepID=UPI001CC33B47|nr:alcohol dehydrogenase 1-like [Dromiciops gliroides]
MKPAKLSVETTGKVIICRAAIAWRSNAPLSIEEVEVDPPKAGEVRIKVISSGICGTDNHIIEGTLKTPLPAILGHEGAGVVESIGEGVSSVKPGDKVLLTAVPQCRKCDSCLHAKGNCCLKEDIFSPVGLMLDGTSRFTCRGRKVHNFFGTSTFTEYTVMHEISVVKINDAAPLENVCIIACAIPTGYGAAVNTAQVTPGSTCVVFGLGGVGSAVVLGCKAAGAARIIGIDINEGKFARAKALGVTDCLNPRNFKKPIQEVVVEMTGFGADFTFEAIGTIETMVSALESCNLSYGVCVIIGSSPTKSQLSFDPIKLQSGRILKGCLLGEYKTRDHIPLLVNDYMKKKIDVDSVISHKLPFIKIKEGFDLLQSGKCIRCVLLF